jgi:choline dehydrogenase
VSQGFRHYANHNQMMESPEGSARRDTSIKDGRRQSPYRAYVHAVARDNLTVATDVEVAEVLFDGDTAVGVRLSDGSAIHADRQVVLSAGTTNTPTILMRSGLGDRQHLTEHGIDTRVDLPGVGRNLHDHVLVPVVWSVPEHADLPAPGEGVVGVAWDLSEPSGPAAILFVDTAPLVSQTVAEKSGVLDRAVMMTLGVRLSSRGRVSLRSADPGASPVIETGYFTHEDDMGHVRAAIDRASRVGDDPALSAFAIERVHPPQGADEETVTEYVRDGSLTFWHQCGTAAMGTGPDAVVDSRLRVRGVQNLRVADASVLPHVPIGNTMAPSVVIGEQAATFIADDLQR